MVTSWRYPAATGDTESAMTSRSGGRASRVTPSITMKPSKARTSAPLNAPTIHSRRGVLALAPPSCPRVPAMLRSCDSSGSVTLIPWSDDQPGGGGAQCAREAQYDDLHHEDRLSACVITPERPENVRTHQRGNGVSNHGETQEETPPCRRFAVRVRAVELDGIDEGVHHRQGNNNEHRGVPGRHTIREEDHLFGRGHIEREKDGSAHHQKEFGPVTCVLLPFLFHRLPIVRAAQLRRRQNGPESC